MCLIEAATGADEHAKAMIAILVEHPGAALLPLQGSDWAKSEPAPNPTASGHGLQQRDSVRVLRVARVARTRVGIRTLGSAFRAFRIG